MWLCLCGNEESKLANTRENVQDLVFNVQNCVCVRGNEPKKNVDDKTKQLREENLIEQQKESLMNNRTKVGCLLALELIFRDIVRLALRIPGKYSEISLSTLNSSLLCPPCLPSLQTNLRNIFDKKGGSSSVELATASRRIDTSSDNHWHLEDRGSSGNANRLV